jgi:nitrite reductase/ring-hydroxylating ferredoxin subunit
MIAFHRLLLLFTVNELIKILHKNRVLSNGGRGFARGLNYRRMTKQLGAIRVASMTDLSEEKPFCVKANGKKLAIFLVGGNAYATDNSCPHFGGPLCKGTVDKNVVTCPWHGSQFNVETGKVLHGPAKKNVTTYPTEIREDGVYVVFGPVSAAPAEPKAVAFKFQPAFDQEHPFSNEGFLTDLLQALKFPFKLYETLPLIVISQDEDEIDVFLGEIHVTEMDVQQLSSVMKSLNEKWKVAITYCLFHASQFPGAMLLNIRGPHAPMNIESSQKY